MYIWELERDKDLRIDGPSFSGTPDPSLSAGANSTIIEVLESSPTKLLFRCVYKLGSQIEAEQKFVIEGMSDNGKAIVKSLASNHAVLLGKTIVELRNFKI